MRVFVTGATGYLGFAVASAFVREGHHVHGMTRSESGAGRLDAAGVRPVVGRLQDPESYRSAAEGAELLVHAAMDSREGFGLDRLAVETLLAAARNRPGFLYTSGVWLYGDAAGGTLDENALPRPPFKNRMRPAIEEQVLADPRVRGIVLRPGCFYGGTGGLTAPWFAGPASGTPATIVGDGSNRWSVVHVEDAAAGFVRAGGSDVSGEIFNLTDRSAETVRTMAEAAAAAVGFAGGVATLSAAQATERMGPLAECLALDQHVDSSKAERVLGWRPARSGFVPEVESCYREWRESRATGAGVPQPKSE
ncbi:MAG: NAD-dependent epimerase/dehydratase family protein [Gemmatimonadales bacterium]